MGNKTVSVQIWDTAGQEKYNSLQGLFYRGSDGCIIVFDITNMQSFLQTLKWKEDFEMQCALRDPSRFPFVIIGTCELKGESIGNKADLVAERAVPHEKAMAVCKEKGFGYFETSAKTGENVAEAFESLAKKALETGQEKMYPRHVWRWNSDLIGLGMGESKKLASSSDKDSGCHC